MVQAKEGTEKVQELVTLPGVLDVFYQNGWNIWSKAGPKTETSLIANVEGVVKAIHTSLVKTEIETSEQYEPRQAETILEHIAKGCKDELRRRKELAQIRRDGAEKQEVLEKDPKRLTKKGSDVGQSAAEAFVQWAKQEEELDNMTRSWEQAMEQELSDVEESSDWMEKCSLKRTNHRTINRWLNGYSAHGP